MNEIKYYIKDLVTGAILPTNMGNTLVILERQNQELEKSGRGYLIKKRPATKDEIREYLGENEKPVEKKKAGRPKRD